MPCRFASSGTVATSRSASRAILALNVASNFLRDLVISVLRRLRQSRTLHTLTFGPISGVHFIEANTPFEKLPGTQINVPRLNLHKRPRHRRCPTSREFRALALFGRRPPQRVDSLVMPASENLHKNGRHEAYRGLTLKAHRCHSGHVAPPPRPCCPEHRGRQLSRGRSPWSKDGSALKPFHVPRVPLAQGTEPRWRALCRDSGARNDCNGAAFEDVPGRALFP